MPKLPSKNEIESAFLSFSKKEWLLFSVFALALVISTVMILQNINRYFLVSVPKDGGSITEGIIGSPRFVNPVLATSDADQDLVSLVYSGLMRKDQAGNLAPNLAEKYEMSADGLQYTFTLRKDASFQDGVKLMAEDVIFTIEKIKDPSVRSPRKGNWDNISVEKIDDRTVRFTLRQPYASFLENATVGIMPVHIWQGASLELNDANWNPVGSGPYRVKEAGKQPAGLIDFYKLTAFADFVLGEPHIQEITLRFYPNEEELLAAFLRGEVNQISSITPENALRLAEKKFRIESSVLPRVFGLFFNQNQNKIFTDKRVAQAINLAVDKEEIINEVLHGYGTVINDPIPPNAIVYPELEKEKNITREEKLKIAEDILAKAGWKLGKSGYLEKTITEKGKKMTTELQFSISTGNAPELAQAAELIRQDLAKIGMRVEIKTFEIGNLNQDIIRPRKYDSLLFGQIVGHESDLVAFWHSSQRLDPGLNVAMYANARVDKILEDAFVTVNEEKRIKKYVDFNQEIKKDMPAVFLYSPNLIYAVSKDLGGFAIDRLTSPPDRFADIHSWFLRTEKVWKIFAQNQEAKS
ncbi:hypothetical protein A3G06_00155 [Candidatus Nomurabacteria bacterium RIFCSPLOWO2_12_FULL_46_14]|uniref:Solute-binding protein family 5 domain-containing protein n=1 Tax=Candidatus Nomurabacteria bacterium RIFCSPLOWO2_12_FULL_46_14 TaxID=1801797 RepID=A0A1F6YC43_9BACT|nr:MAG: hypothetical protein A3G06_00155 [Candidatus Nomurabacteria bacterium RIFCSPLOWO2_12_FULL_46_14]